VRDEAARLIDLMQDKGIVSPAEEGSRWREVLYPDQPLNRAAKPEEIANVILFLSCERASWICGEVVNVDGGKLHRDNWF